MGKQRPPGADQPDPALPYSQVLKIACSKLVVLSGQVAEDAEGKILEGDIKTQTRYALENCRRRLADAGCTFDDVFKTTIFLRDSHHWEAMNEVYTEMMPFPRPVRTAVQAGLFPGCLVEIEMWASSPD
ncbi:MAG: RidA family protein [Spirochaetaceae bacterium]|jgi:2-iminobutanoate/2-iminopropanoate deaminase|nr:RidA family protein [Spirochaetaceae bacterium]